ncbi:unnamed protein product, partial [Heterosigma akashiwo]
MPPCKSVNPLRGGGYKIEEYEAMERDNGKYLLYYAAIKEALVSLSTQKIGKLEICVMGAGSGRLVQFCVDECREIKRDFRVVALDANPLAVAMLTARFGAVQEVEIEGPFKILPDCKSTDLPLSLQGKGFCLCVSELLGSFADNEFCPELQQVFCDFLLDPVIGIQIPRSWTTYLVPVSCPDTWKFLQESGRCLQITAPPVFLHGFAGHFSAELWEGLTLDTRPWAPGGRTAFHWETWFFPL